MVGLRSIHEPVEVYLAAVGDPEPLARRIECGVHMDAWERETLACFLRGGLTFPKLKRGQSTFPHLPQTESYYRRRQLEGAAKVYQEYMTRLKEKGSKYGRRAEVLEHVAALFDLDTETLDGFLRRSSNTGLDKEASPDQIVLCFHIWLHRTGRLDHLGSGVRRVLPRYLRELWGSRATDSGA